MPVYHLDTRVTLCRSLDCRQRRKAAHNFWAHWNMLALLRCIMIQTSCLRLHPTAAHSHDPSAQQTSARTSSAPSRSQRGSHHQDLRDQIGQVSAPALGKGLLTSYPGTLHVDRDQLRLRRRQRSEVRSKCLLPKPLRHYESSVSSV